MNHQFKRGDLAMIISSRNEENIGRVVRVTGFAREGELVKHEVGVTRCRTDCVVVEGGIVVRKGHGAKKCLVSRHAFRHNRLMPLRGDFAPEQQKSREVNA